MRHPEHNRRARGLFSLPLVLATGLCVVSSYAQPIEEAISIDPAITSPEISSPNTLPAVSAAVESANKKLESQLRADDTQRLERLRDNLRREISDMEAAAKRELKSLAEAENNVTSEQISAASLEEIRLDIASLRSQRNSLSTRLVARKDSLRDLRVEISRLETQIDTEENLTGDEKRAVQDRLETYQSQRKTLTTVVDQIAELRGLMDDRLGTTRQRMSLLQSRFELPDLNSMTRTPSWEQLKIRRDIDRLLEEASNLRSEAANVTDVGPSSLAKRRLLQVQAQVAEEKVEFLALELKRQRAEQILSTLGSFTRTQSTPLRVLHVGARNVRQLEKDLTDDIELLERRAEVLADQLAVIQQQGRFSDENSGETQAKELEELRGEAVAQLKADQALLSQAETISKNYQRAIAERSQTALWERNEWPADITSWKRVLTSMAKLPNRVVQGILSAFRRLTAALHGLYNGEGIIALLVGLSMLILGVWCYRKISAAVTRFDADDSRSIEVPLRILKQNWFWLLIPVTLGVVGYLLKLDINSITLLLTPLLIWPVVSVSMAFATHFLNTYTPDLDKQKTRLLIREARWVIALTAVLAAFLIIAQAVALSPLVISALEGISMLCLLLIAIPLVHLRRLIVAGATVDPELLAADDDDSDITGAPLAIAAPPASTSLKKKRSFTSRIVSISTLALVATLVVSALVGIFGYVNLAWAIARYVAVSVGVLMLWMLLRSMLQDFTRQTDARLTARDATSSAFWRQCVLAPAYGMAVLLLTVGAGWLLYLMFGWNAETPIVQAIPELFGHTLFKVGETEVQFSNFIVAALIVFMVFRAASWSREVTFRFAFKKIADSGIRNSLSTFVQYAVVVVGLMIALRTIGLNLTALSVFAGALGVGIGFGMQQIVVNFISGILLLIERPLSTTDLVNVDKYEGEVTHIGIRSLTVKTFDAQEVIIPNSAVITKPFTNWTRSDDVMRTVLMIGISYDDDPEEAIRIISKIVLSHEATLDNPGAKVTFWEFADSAQIIRIHLFTRIRGSVGRLDVRSQLLLSIRTALSKAGMTIPFPQRDIHVHDANKTTAL